MKWTRRQVLGVAAAGLLPRPAWAGRPGGRLPAWGTPSERERAVGRAALRQWVDGHGGRAAWESLSAVRCEVESEWAAAGRMWGPPLPVGTALPRLTVDFRADKARLDFDDRSGSRWGFDSTEAWTADARGRTYPDAHHAARVLPTLKWYAAMPHKLLDPGVRHRLVDGDPAAVLIQFSTARGQTGDTMLASFRQGRLASLRHTARALGDGVRAEARFVDWSQVGTVWLPREVHVSLLAPAAIQDVQKLRFVGWSAASVPPGFFEKPADVPRRAGSRSEPPAEEGRRAPR